MNGVNQSEAFKSEIFLTYTQILVWEAIMIFFCFPFFTDEASKIFSYLPKYDRSQE